MKCREVLQAGGKDVEAEYRHLISVTRQLQLPAVETSLRMVTQSADTSPKAERVWFGLMRSASAAKKFSLVEDTTRMMRQTLMAGIRLRHGGASEAALRRHFAEAWLGSALATKAYGTE